MNQLEHRIIGSSIRLLEARDSSSAANDSSTAKLVAAPRLGGYAARFLTRSLPLGFEQFYEQIDPQAFDESLAKQPDIRFTLNHDPSRIFGRTRAGTLQVSRDDNGLLFEVDLPHTDEARTLATAIERGDISQCSFAFRTLQDDWSTDESGMLVRTLLRLDINNGDVSAVTYPAYEQTEVEVRSIIEYGRERLAVRGWQRAASARVRQLLLAEVE
ncbi:MAG TPA: HK97 family phage prohead protease [Scandinavium sp.]|uniref:HK97 family phage prohead protease n=1 Tax=Scandinavium sp. TaxID=2830653 RepID=UPI002E3101E5|nr:HK97 family phage prohead protease [Scandinavium sp.]HEX4499834.1 HK97 family phage prohead protease [Scandinavium sp.]